MKKPDNPKKRIVPKLMSNDHGLGISRGFMPPKNSDYIVGITSEFVPDGLEEPENGYKISIINGATVYQPLHDVKYEPPKEEVRKPTKIVLRTLSNNFETKWCKYSANIVKKLPAIVDQLPEPHIIPK